MQYRSTTFKFLSLFVLTYSFLGWSEAEPNKETTSRSETVEVKLNKTSEDDADKADRKSGISRLMNKLKNKDGNFVDIGIVSTVDYTTLNFGDLAEEHVIQAITRLGDLKVKRIGSDINSLTLQEFRRVVTRGKVDIAIVVVLKPTNFDVFLYDRRTPYYIYTHTEVLPEELQYKVTAAVVEEYSKVLVRRVFYSYMQDQYFELPRDETTPLLRAELPRWVASRRSLATVNRELTSRMYGSAAVGAAVMTGSGNTWNSNMLGLSLGVKVFKDIYVEGALELFSYNAVVASGKYMITNLDSPARFLFGLGFSQTINGKTINWDQKNTQGFGSTYVVPSAAILFPIVDVHFKVESQIFVGLGGEKLVFALLPGLFILF